MDSTTKMSLLELNNDCLFSIFKYLDIIDYIHLLHTCERLKYCIQDYYHGKNITLDDKIWTYCRKGNGELLHTFLKCIVSVLRKLISVYINQQFVRYLPLSMFTEFHGPFFENDNYKYNKDIECKCYINQIPKPISIIFQHYMGYPITSLYWELIFPNVKIAHIERINISDIKLFAEMFPKVEVFIYPYFGSHNYYISILDFKYLTQLHLSPCYSLTPKNMENIFSSLSLKKLIVECESVGQPYLHEISKCQTIEEICFNDYYGNHVSFDDLHQLKLLSKISFMVWRNLNVDFPIISNIVWKFLGINEYYSPSSWQLNESFICNLNDIRHFIFTGIYFGEYTDNVLTILSLCKNLEIFDFSQTNFDIIYLVKVLNIFRNNFPKREKQLLIRCCKSYIFEKRAMELDIPHFVKLSFKNENLDELEPYKAVIHCDWIRN